ncbi:U-box domain-containing protein 4 [Beta vulgaris subsp. vulgaris]|uniref:U-box domain-containing protein 4 n=1 Tax=Beta vulgaris subsp. vulgaris TaxID=3555 RepID=UPI002036C728|nr:U-box domain-containing protein 4 [Beta vulgaris subsp. vulgaris]
MQEQVQLFLKMRRFFMQPKKPTKKQPLPHDFNDHKDQNNKIQSDLGELNEEKTEDFHVVQEKTEKIDKVIEGVVLQRAVKELLFGSCEERENAAKEIKRLALEDVKMRKSLGELGVIPPLVSMVDSGGGCRRQLAVQALTMLSDGSFTNKALILEAGILTKLPTNIEEVDEHLRHDLSQLLLSISSLFNSQYSFNQSTLFSFLLNILQSNSTTENSKEACLGTLYNLSIVIENSGPLISNRVVDILLSLLSSSREKISEQALATLGNLVVTLMGKKALEDNVTVPESLIDILTWEDRPKCQEFSVYILMILAHQSSKQREKMAKSGIVHTLLEVALLGSPLAQKRAMKLLQWFKNERQVKVGPHSGPQTRFVSPGSAMSDGETSEGKRLMKKMVQQSLHRNMEVITKRANAEGDTLKLKSLVISSSSKSLPY